MVEFPPLWSDFHRFGETVACIDAATGRMVTYRELMDLIAAVRERLPTDRKALVALRVAPTAEAIAIYLGALYAGHAVLFSSPLTPATVSAYGPEIVVADSGDDTIAALPGFVAQDRILGRNIFTSLRQADDQPIHPSVALVLPTSGSTGTRRFIKLSYTNIHASALQVASGLNITSTDCAITNLPLDYVYGLSILHSHLKVGARIVLEQGSFLRPSFWDSFRRYQVTGFGGVPFTYKTLRDMGFDRYGLASLSTLTQAGGPLNLELKSWLVRTFGPRGVRVHFMYGLSEAAGRVSILPQTSLETHLGSVGVAVPYGALAIGNNGEVLYRGPNVMLGYALSRQDLTTGDALGGVLHTGDLGALGDDGHLYIKGRLSRYGKVFGKRIALDELEQEYAGGSILCLDAADDRLNVYHDGSSAAAVRAQLLRLCQSLEVPPQAVKLCEIAEIPRTPNGKIDYPRLMEASTRGAPAKSP